MCSEVLYLFILHHIYVVSYNQGQWCRVEIISKNLSLPAYQLMIQNYHLLLFNTTPAGFWWLFVITHCQCMPRLMLMHTHTHPPFIWNYSKWIPFCTYYTPTTHIYYHRIATSRQKQEEIISIDETLQNIQFIYCSWVLN